MYSCCRGEAKIVVDASTHEAQFPKLFDPNNSILARELGTYAVYCMRQKNVNTST